MNMANRLFTKLSRLNIVNEPGFECHAAAHHRIERRRPALRPPICRAKHRSATSCGPDAGIGRGQRVGQNHAFEDDGRLHQSQIGQRSGVGIRSVSPAGGHHAARTLRLCPTAASVTVYLVLYVVSGVHFFNDLRPYLFTTYVGYWRGLFREQVAWSHLLRDAAKRRNTLLGQAMHALMRDETAVVKLLAGDLNLDIDLGKRRDLFSDDAYLDVETYNTIAQRLVDATVNTGSTAEPDRRLDYIFVDPKQVTVTNSGPWKGKRIADMDYDPVVADLQFYISH
jgi:hypothetical protein